MRGIRASTRPVSKVRGRPFMLTLGAVGIGFALLLLYIGYHAPVSIPGRSYYNLHAVFNDADNLTRSYQVRVGGRLVGQVLNPRVEHGKGVVDLQLTPDIKPLLSDTKLKVRPRSAVGVRFVELTPGTKGHPLKDGATIGANQTSETVQLDEALDTFDASRRRKAQILLNQLGVGMVGRGEDNNATIHAAPGFLSDIDQVSQAVNAKDGAPQRFIAGSEGAADAADPVRQTIATGFKPEQQALEPFTKAASGLRKALDTAPGALTQIRSGLVQTDPLLTKVDGLARAATPALRAGVPALKQFSALLSESRPGLRDVRQTLDLVHRAVPPTLGLLDTVNPVLPNLQRTLTLPLNVLTDLGPRGCDINTFAKNWGSMLGFGNSGGSVLRFNLTFSAESLIGATKTVPSLVPVHQNPYPKPCASGRDGK
jgi:ABC-type transporter Mla subunit MlaD